MNQADRPRQADFHTHSTASDGTLAPAALIQESAQRGLDVVALTDHDTTSGVGEAVETGRRLGVKVIAGIELSVGIQRGELHLLGYGIDPGNAALQSHLARMRRDRRTRATSIIARLKDLGIHLPDDLLSGIHEDESIGRPHIGRALVEAGVVESVSGAFDRFLGRGQPAFVAKPMISPADAINVIRAAGGVAVMAHPFSAPDFRELLPEFVEAGLAGIECYYGEYSEERRSELVSIADDLGLVTTGGSDYHGPGFRAGRELGSVKIPGEAVDALLVAAEQK